MKAIVTGANGFLGSALCDRLQKEGYEVTALVRKNSNLDEIQHLNLNYAYGDVTDIQSLKDAFKGHDQVFHLAGVVAYKASERELMNKVNIHGTHNVIDALSLQPETRLLHLSSVVAVGASFKPEPLNENSEYNIHHLNLGYFETKHEAEIKVIEAVKQNKIQALCVNPSTIYGFGDAKKGSRKTQVKVARGQFPFYTGGGVNVVSVEDICEGILLALKKGKNGERYILSSENLTIKNLFEKISYFAGVSAPRFYLPFSLLKIIGRIGDLTGGSVSLENAYTSSMYHWFNNDKARHELGFNPKTADYAIENSVKWMRDNGYLNK